MITELFRHPDYLHILFTLRKHAGLRFNQIQKTLDLNPAEVNRALKFLRKGMWIVPHTLPTQGDRLYVEYSLGKRGLAFLELFDSFVAGAKQKSAVLGSAEIKELQLLAR